MFSELSFTEIRVLACLIEKERTTPEYYPLTLNSLIAACNQKSNRDPVVDLDEEAVTNAVDALREKKLAFRVDVAGSRVAKFRHSIDQVLDASKAEMAVLCTLMLRGPQTPGELRTRSERMHPFASIAEVVAVLEEMKTEHDAPLVAELSRQPGRKEIRFVHCLAPIPKTSGEAEPDAFKVAAGPERFSRQEGDALVAQVVELAELVRTLEARLTAQEAELQRLRAEWEA